MSYGHSLLRTPFLSSSDPTLIQFPINVILSDLNLMGIVRYSDGTCAMLPVDNTKFQILGFNAFVSTIVGQSFDVVLKYNLSPDEAVFSASSVDQAGFHHVAPIACAPSIPPATTR